MRGWKRERKRGKGEGGRIGGGVIFIAVRIWLRTVASTEDASAHELGEERLACSQ